MRPAECLSREPPVVSYYRIFIFEAGVSTFNTSERHNPDKADKFIKELHSNMMPVSDVPADILSEDTVLLDYIARRGLTGVYASRDGYIIEDCDLVFDIFWKDSVRQKLLQLFPRHRILVVMNHSHIPDFGYAFFENGQMQRIFHITVEDEADIESDCYFEGEISQEEIDLIKQSVTRSDNLSDAYDVIIENQVFKDVKFEDLKKSMIGWALGRYSVSDSLDVFGKSGCSFYRKRPWWHRLIPGR